MKSHGILEVGLFKVCLALSILTFSAHALSNSIEEVTVIGKKYSWDGDYPRGYLKVPRLTAVWEGGRPTRRPANCDFLLDTTSSEMLNCRAQKEDLRIKQTSICYDMGNLFNTNKLKLREGEERSFARNTEEGRNECLQFVELIYQSEKTLCGAEHGEVYREVREACPRIDDGDR